MTMISSTEVPKNSDENCSIISICSDATTDYSNESMIEEKVKAGCVHSMYLYALILKRSGNSLVSQRWLLEGAIRGCSKCVSTLALQYYREKGKDNSTSELMSYWLNIMEELENINLFDCFEGYRYIEEQL